VASIVNGLFAGRAGISSHGTAIAAVGDNISNANTIGYKAIRAEFEDFVAGGQAAGKVLGSGSNISGITSLNQQGTFESTGRGLDMAIDGNGYFVVANGPQRFYTRAGNFNIDSSGFLVNQNGLAVMGFSANGTGALEPLNINAVSQSSVVTANATLAGNLNASAPVLAGAIPVVSPAGQVASTTTYADLNNASEFSTVIEVFDSLGNAHPVTTFFFKTGNNEYTAVSYVNSQSVDPGANPVAGLPREIGSVVMEFGGDGLRTAPPVPGAPDIAANIPWNSGADAGNINFNFSPFTQFAASANILSLDQDGQGVGSVVSMSIQPNGDVFAVLNNGQSAIIGTIALANFANSEGLERIGGNLLQRSGSSGEPIIGQPGAGQMGTIDSGSLELSTVDIASEFVKMITLQRGFQANSRIITTINQLLNEIIQLA